MRYRETKIETFSLEIRKKKFQAFFPEIRKKKKKKKLERFGDSQFVTSGKDYF